MSIACIIDIVLLVDLVLHLIVYGPVAIAKHKKEFVWEGILQVVFICLIIPYFSTSSLSTQIRMVELLALLFLFRLPIVCTLFMELKDFQVIMLTGKKMLSPFLSVLFSLYLVIFMFKTVGVLWFGGLVTLAEAQNIGNIGSTLNYLLNFNDTYSAMLTLFVVLVSNNWNDTTDIYCMLVDNLWPRLFFGIFFFLTIFVILNIVTSFVLDIYDNSLEES